MNQHSNPIFDISQAPNSIQKLISEEFNNQIAFFNAYKKKHLFKFQSWNTNQLLSMYNFEKNTIFKESNVKKHVQKIQEMIFSEFALQKTSHYFNFFFQPTSQKEIYERRKEIIQNLEEEYISIKEEAKQISEIKYSIQLPFTIYTLDQATASHFYDRYKISMLSITQRELEEMVDQLDENSIILSEETLFIDAITYNKQDFETVVLGMIVKNNKQTLLAYIDILNKIPQSIQNLNEHLFSQKQIEFNKDKLKEILLSDLEQDFKELSNLILNLDQEVEEINKQVKEKIANKQVNLQGQELLDLLNSGSLDALQKKIEEDTKAMIQKKEHEILHTLKEKKLNATNIFENNSYPLSLDLETKEDLFKQIERKRTKDLLEYYATLNQLSYHQIDELTHLIYSLDLLVAINNFIKKYHLHYPKEISKEIYLENGRNMYIQNAHPISYGIGTSKLDLNQEKVSILTGANSGGKTTLLEMVLQAQVLASIGLPGPYDENSSINLPEEIIYLKKFTGTQGSGAFEQTIRALVDILDSNTTKLMLIDEFEAVTEPGAAAKILLMFLSKIKEKEALTIAVSHLGKELDSILKEKQIKGIRIDGISATGLDEQGNLITKHQPVFYELGKSTPELIMQRILQDTKFWNDKQVETKHIFEKLLD